MRKAEHPSVAERRFVRCASDLTDGEWALVEPLIPSANHGGHKRTLDVREKAGGEASPT